MGGWVLGSGVGRSGEGYICCLHVLHVKSTECPQLKKEGNDEKREFLHIIAISWPRQNKWWINLVTSVLVIFTNYLTDLA